MKVKLNKAQYLVDIYLKASEFRYEESRVFIRRTKYHIGWIQKDNFKEIILIERKLVESNWIPVKRSSTPLA
jgi:hypothetical protein